MISILIVDDESDYLEIVSERLRIKGFEVDSVGTAFDAMSMLENKAYQAVVMDLMMPGLDGMEALKNIHRAHPGIKVILQTGHATPGRRDLAAKLGATALMEKPIDLDLLAKTIREE